MKPQLLFLCHRIPYPPNKGDKIRSYHLLHYLSRHYNIYLGAFIDDQADWDNVTTVEKMCAECCFIRLNPNLARLKSLSGFVTGQPLTVPYYFSQELTHWIRSRVEQHRITRLIVYSSAMAQYAHDHSIPFERKIIDFVDVDSDKWRQYASKKSWPMSWVYQREADSLLRFEQDVALEFDACLFVSSTEADMFRQLAPNSEKKIDFFTNGVDTEYFSPENEYPNPYSKRTRALVFTGAMDYWPNVEAVYWFAREVFPELLLSDPDAVFYIVGSNPTDKVRQLEREPGIVVTGRVEDVRPYLSHAKAAVAPMKIARGIQNKVLEAMAMERPVIVSGLGLEGIKAENGKEILLADDREEYINFIQQLFAGEHQDIGRMARQRVKHDFNWENNLPMVARILENGLQLNDRYGTED